VCVSSSERAIILRRPCCREDAERQAESDNSEEQVHGKQMMSAAALDSLEGGFGV